MRKLLCLLLFVGSSLMAFAQATENCSDGIDNDGDGRIDCFDSKCGGNPVCQGTYIGNDTDCQVPQPPGSDFEMVLYKESDEHVASTHGRFVIGDMGHPTLGKDGKPEVVTAHTYDKKIYILDGESLDIKYEATSPYRIDRYDIAIADVRNNNCASIFVVEVDRHSWDRSRDKHYISSWDCEAKFLWRTQVPGRPFTLALADFNHDGKAEIYFKNMILDAVTGNILVNGSGDWSQVDAGPVAVDILDEYPGLELVAGGEIYAVDIAAGTATVVREYNDIPGLVNKEKWNTKSLNLDTDLFVNSQTSIADFDLDGKLDVLMTGTSDNGKTTIFYWNLHNPGASKVYRPANNWKYGAGRLNLADLDGDGQMNVAFVTGNYIYALDENLELLWRKGIDEQSSGYTSTTVFDFNNDGAAEIVYRDETYLYIIDGTGKFSPGIPCKSYTSNDYPIVADVDGDGSTEICVICQDDFDDKVSSAYREGVIRTYKSGNEPWVSSRKVWNQHGYFNVNVNDDLTIPQHQQKQHVVFSEDKCGPGENRVLNSFLNQSAILNTDGCKTYPSADIAFVANPDILNIVPPTCPDQDFLVGFTLRNTGSLDLTANIPITFYNGNPTVDGVKLKTEYVAVSDFKKGDQIVVPPFTVTGTGNLFTLYVVLNDKGDTSPFTLPNSGIEECNLGNNMASVSVRPTPFALTASSTDHVQCGTDPAPPNGSVRVFKPEGSVEQTVGYTFYWFDGTTAGPEASADHTGPLVTGLPGGTYTVYATNDAFKCGSDTVQVVVGNQTLSVNATVTVDHAYTNCNSPDGQLSVTPATGVVDDYTYEWFEGTVFGTTPPLSHANVLEFTKALTYSVLVKQISTGCETLESGTVPDMTVTPVVNTSFTPANCVPANSGQAMADVGGATAGYSFYWYDGSTALPTEDYLGHTYSSLVAGNYTVVARDNTTGCRSNAAVVAVPSVSSITVTAQITAQQTSCAAPNGAAAAHVGNVTAGYTFRWFEGNNTTTQIGTGPAISGLAAGDYTVEGTNTATGCTDTELITIVDNIQTPTVTPNVVAHQSNCLPANGSVSATASGSPGGYNFYWFNGNVGTPDTTAANFKGATYSGVAAGSYTVVAVDVNTRCASPRAVIQVLDQTVNPVVTTSTIGQSNCDPANPNGQASALVGGTATGYKFRWFAGADTTTFLVQNPVLTDRAAGTYTVKAQNRATGCFTTQVVTINDISAKPTLSLSKLDNAVCSAVIGYTGSVTAAFATNPNAQGTDTYVYEWRRNGVVIPGETASTITGRDAATYSVTVTNQRLKCTSDPVSIVVNDVVDLPTITTAQDGSTNCDPAFPDGRALVTDVDGAGTGAPYTFQWHTGVNTSAPIAGATSAIATGLQGGTGKNYTVLVTNQDNGCQNTATILVADESELPVLVLTPTPNGICDPSLTASAYNGTITAAVTNIVGGLGDYTFALGGGSGVQDASPNHNRFLELNGNTTYSVTATHTPTGCVSDATTVLVPNNQDTPDITTAQVGSTNCDPAVPNGEAQVTDVDGAGTGSPYIFQWHTGVNTSTPIAGANAAIVTGVQGGTGRNYTVLVTNQDNGCQNTATVLVADESEIPVLALTPTPNSICDPSLTTSAFDGTITAAVTNIVGGLGDYTFALAGGSGVQDASPNHNRFLELNGNITYSVTATHTATGCVSDATTVLVVNNQDMPDITTAQQGSTNCDPNLPNGEAQVTDVDGAGTGTPYIFQWHTGVNTSTPVAGANAAIVSGVQGGTGRNYTVLVTNQDNGCQNTATVLVADESEIPVLALTPTPNSICDPSLTTSSFNGTITAAVTNIVGILNDYTFALAGGSHVQDASPNHNRFLELDGDITYSVTTTHTPTGCTSDATTVLVVNNQDIPDITTAQVGSTNCDLTLPNGEAQVTDVDGAGIGAPYIFQWHTGVNISAPIGGATAAIVTNVQGGTNRNYTVLVTNQDNGCQNTATVLVADESELPVLALTPTPNSICDPSLASSAFNGTITATVTNIVGLLGDYTFALVGGAHVQDASPNHNRFLELDGDITYSVTTKHTPTGCESDPATVLVVNDQFIPVIDIAVTPQTACVGDNGILAATVNESSIGGAGGVNTGYTFDWFQGVSAGGTPVATTTGINGVVNQLPGNLTYTVRVTSNASGCRNTASVALPENIVLPDPSIVAVDQTECAPANGELIATVTPAPSQTYSFFWLKEQPFTATTDPNAVIAAVSGSPANPNRMITAAPGVDTDTHNQIIFGSYTLVVRDDYTQCLSLTSTEIVTDQTHSDIEFNVLAQPSACATSDGQLEMEAVRMDGTPTTYSFEIYRGGPTNVVIPVDFYTNPPVFDPNAPFASLGPVPSGSTISQANLNSDLYAVIATDGAGCKTLETFFLPFVDAHDIEFTAIDSKICPVTLGDGTITVRAVAPPTDPGANQSDFTFGLYRGGTNNAANLLGPVVISEVAGDGIDNDGDGSIDEADPVLNGPNKYTWPASGVDCTTDPGNPACQAYVSVVDLSPGFYTVEVQENISGQFCKVLEVIEIKPTALPPVITLDQIIANTACDLPAAADGSIAITVAQDPADPNAPTYDITMSPDPNGFSLTGQLPGSHTASQLVPDLYTFTVLASNGCQASTSFEVPDQPAIPVMAPLSIANQLICLPDGSVTVNDITVNSVVVPHGTFDFTWYRDDVASAPIIPATTGEDVLDITNYPTIEAGTYFVVAQRTTGQPGAGCESVPVRAEIKDESVDPAITLTPFSNTSCDPAIFEGEIEVEIIDNSVVPPVPGPAFGFNYAWAAVTPGLTVPAAGTFDGLNNLFIGLQHGTYQLTATNTTTGCASVKQVTILENTTPIFVQSVSAEAQLYCTPSGSLEVENITYNDRTGAPNTVNGAGLADFTFEWFRGGTTAGDVLGVSTAVLDSANYASIGADENYYVVATRVSNAPGLNCSSAPFKVAIVDESVAPTITLTPFSNTSCDPMVFEGEIEVDVIDNSLVPPVPGPAFVFNYTWAPISPAGLTVPAPGAFNGADNLFTALEHGTYQLTAVNNTTGCSSVQQVTIQQNTTPIFVQSVLAEAQLYCTPSGSLEVQNITYNDRTGAPTTVNGAGLADFTFEWFRGGTSAVNVVGGSTPTLDSANYAAIGADANYYVVATRASNTPGLNCTSAPFKVAIVDESVAPAITLTPFSNTSCDPMVFEGEIEVDVIDNSLVPPVPGPAFVFDYTWAPISPAGLTVPAPGSYDGVDNLFTTLEHGTYQLTAVNNTTGCSSVKQVTIQQNTTPIFVQSVLAEAQLYCTPSGSLEVQNITYNDRTGAPTTVNGAGLTDFTFEWFRGGTAAGDVLGVSTAILDSANYAFIGADENYYVVATRVSNAPGLNCSSAPFKVAIVDESVAPTITLTPFSNTSCDPMVFEGEIEVDVIDNSQVPPVPGPAFVFNYTWAPISPAGLAVPAPGAFNGADNIFTTLEHGTYQLTAVNNTTGCTSVKQVTIQQNTTPIFVQSVLSDAQLFCLPSGSLEVENITYNDRTGASTTVNGVGLGDFTFEWFRGGTAAANVVGGSTSVLDSTATNYPAIGADENYYVIATRVSNVPGLNCSSAPFRVAIEDKRIFPEVDLLSTANSTCINTYDAQITLTAKTAGVGNGAAYNLDWTAPAGFSVIADAMGVPANPYTTTAADNIGPGTYTVTVTNVLTECATDASVEVLQHTTPVQILNVAKVDQRDCDPFFDGSITIDDTNPNHVSVVGDYTFTWEKDGVALTPVPDNALTGVGAGLYKIIGTKDDGVGAGCPTAPFSVTLLDLTEKPVIDLQSIANFACDPAQANGQISALIFEGANPANFADYTMEWRAGKNVTVGPTIPAAAPGNQLLNQLEGDYTFRVTDNASPNRGCVNSATLAINFDKTSFTVAIDAIDQTVCVPGQNGSVTVTGIEEVRNGVRTPAADLSLFGYQWFDESGTAHPSTPTFTAGATTINNLLAGAYSVAVRNALGCVSTQTASLVEDATVLPVITLDNFQNPAICILPETPGYLQVSADNSLDFANYTFEWFQGADDTGAPIVANNPTLSNILYNQPDQYTVRVTNLSTHCVNLDTYRFSVDTVDIRVLASAVARTNCLMDNGSLFATTLDGTGALYNYEWYAGASTTGTPVYTTKEISNVPIGQYTVVAVNPNHAFCKTRPYTINVADQRVLPPVVAVQKNPLTYCDPANPNGVAFASVNNQVDGFTFDWFEGGATGAPIYTGPEAKNLTATTYVVRATDVHTGCEQTASILIENDPVNVPEPTIVILSHHTNCVTPDGMLSASVRGNTVGYLLEWYNGSSVRSAADETGEFHRDLEEGFYTVTATDNISGCVSDPVTAEVLPFREDPEFNIAVIPTNCEQDIGQAAVEMLNQVQVSTIEWNINGSAAFGARVSDLPKGEFIVTVTTALQCTVSKNFVIEPEVLVFNGISRNNDGQNDFFEIACIQDFPNNNVKIFNRAGTLVYEANGYDNQDVFFDGVSNRGISLLGTDLPDGTYFYIIDKRNGSKPRTGYLELLR